MDQVNEIRCKVASIEPLTPIVSKVVLSPNQPMSFKAGQYLRVVMGEEDKRPFSIANAPDPQNSDIELHIGAGPGNSYAGEVLECMQNDGEISVDGGHGEAHLRENLPRPTILMAGGTGFSYIKSMFEHLVEIKSERPLIVYWGLRSSEACYELAETKAMIESLPHAQFIPVVENADEDWQGKVGLVHQVAMKDIVSFEPYDIYLAGRFDMVGAVRTDFVEHGAEIGHMYADAFAFI